MGQNGGPYAKGSGTIVASYSSGDVSGRGDVGGLVGENYARILISYSTGAVHRHGGEAVGGLIGRQSLNNNDPTVYYSVAHSYWSTTDTTRTFGVGSDDENNNNMIDEGESNTVVGYSTSDLQAPTGYTEIYVNWDNYDQDGNTGTEQPWCFGTSSDLPALKPADGTCPAAGGAEGAGKAENQPPTANAGADQTVAEGATVTLAGSGTDPEGQTLTYAWTAPSGITLSDASAAKPTFTAPDRTADYTLTFSLVVNDGSSDSAADTVEISVTADNDAPGAPSLADQTATVGTAFSYTFAAVSDPEGATPSYTAQQVASDDTASALPGWLSFNAGSRTFSCAASGDGACEAGTLTIRVTASDGASPTPATSSASFTLTVKEDGASGAGGEGEEGERAPSAPRNLSLTPGDGHIAVSWQAPKDLGNPEIDSYYVEFREVGDEQWVSAGEFDGASATIEFLENGTEYEVRVAVFNVHGEAIAGPGRATPSAG